MRQSNIQMDGKTQQYIGNFHHTFPALTSLAIWATQHSLPTWVIENWPPMTLLSVHHCSFLGPRLIDTDHCSLGTSHKSCSFGEALILSSRHHNLALLKLVQIPTLAHFPASNASILKTRCSLAALYFPLTNRCHDEKIISLFQLSLVIMWSLYVKIFNLNILFI